MLKLEVTLRWRALQGSGCMQPTGNADRVFRPKVFLVAHSVPAQGLASSIAPIIALAFALVDREGKIFDECARRLPPNVVHETNDFVMTLVKAQVALPHRTSVIKSATSLEALQGSSNEEIRCPSISKAMVRLSYPTVTGRD